MSFTDEYLALQKKKKKKEEEQKTTKKTTGHSFTDEYLSMQSTTKKEEDIAPLFVNKTASLYSSENIAPVAKAKAKAMTEEQEERKWFQKGAFEDGYQFGDIARTIMGTSDDLTENLLAGVLGMGEKVVDAGAYLVGGVGGLFGADEFKEKTAGFIKKDLYDEEKVAKKIIGSTLQAKFNERIGGNSEDSSLLGEKSDALVQSAGQLAGTLGLQAVGVPWFVTSGVVGFGSEAENALNQGASYGKAGLSAAISAGAEILTEKLFGGSGLGETGLLAVDTLTKGITSKAVKALADYGIDIAAEGAEEVISEFVSNLGSSLYKEQKLGEILFSEEAIDSYIESFIGGGVLGGVMNASNAVGSVKSGRDYRSGLSVNEQKVFDKEVENRIAEQEKGGKKLTNKEKAVIEEAVVRDMEKGYISTDTIEEVLGGESYNTYKRTVHYEDSLLNEFTELNRMKQGDMTGEQQDRRMELKQQLEDIKQNSKRELYKTNLSENVFRSIQSDRLMESYNEKARRGQAFDADLTKYDAKQQETIKKAVESGILNNTNRTHEFVDMIAKITADKGVLFDFTNNERLKESGFAVDGKAVNGYVTKDGVTLNIDSAKSLNSVVGHEITHVLEGTELYTALQSAVSEYAKTKGDYQGRYDSLSKLYEGVEGADVDAELTADLVGDYLFTDADFVRNLSVQHRNVFQKIYDEIKYLCKVATAGSKEARELEKVKRAFEQAYREGGKQSEDAESEVQYSLVEDQETIDFLENQDYVTTYKAMVLIDGKLYPPMASQSRVEEEYTDKKGNKKTKTVRKLKNPSILGRWQQSDENRALAEQKYDPKKGYSSFDLLKSNGKTVPAAYNPYEHTSNIVLNDQFEEAYNRPELVTVEYHIPVSELTSGYKAEYAKDAVGLHEWKSGPVAKDLENPRQVYLTRWSKPVRILPDSEVAAKYKEILDGTGLSVPFNVVTPSLLSELEKAGVAINYDGSPMYQSIQRRAADKKSKEAVKYSLDGYTSEMEGSTKKVIGNLKRETMASKYGLRKFASYTSERIEREIQDSMAEGLPDYAHSYIAWVNPEDFLRATTIAQRDYERIREEAGDLDHDRLKQQSQPIYLTIGKDGEIIGHEGRHRISALGKAGYDRVAVILRSAMPNDIGQMLFPEERMKLKGQSFERGYYDSEGGFKNKTVGKGVDFYIHDLLPLSERFADTARKMFSETEGSLRYSLSDSDGKQLSKEQQEYFKDSKVRDENGNLKVMYHGTPNGDFTVFKDGTYFTDNKEYADRYQSTSASSISSGKVASDPKTFEVYLDIKKPFDITDEEARDIYINEYIKGGNAMGINPYLSDAEYDKIRTIDWTEGEDLRDFLIENDYDYDGLVLDEGADGGYGDEVSYRGKSYVVFSSEQVKNIDNTNPTSDPDIRFSLSKPVEESKNLMALHNLSEQKLLKSLQLGGLPMPSIAIAKAKDGHGEFGEISLVFPKDTIDPEYSRKNKLYSGDAWTPTYPKVDYKPNEKVLKEVKKKTSALVPYEVQDVLGNLMFDTDNARDNLDRYNGNMVEAYKQNDAMKYAYLKATGSDISLPVKEADLFRYGEVSNAAVRYFAGRLIDGLQTVELYRNMSARDMLQDKALTEAVADAQNFDVLRTLEPGSDEYLEYERNPVFRADEVAFRDIDSFLSAARKLYTNGVQQTVDRRAAKELIRDKVDQAAYESWLEGLFSGIVEKEGIRNNKDTFTPSGNRRSFEALHYEHNLENVIKAMRETGEKGIGFGGGSIFGAATTEFSSVEDMKRSSDRLQKMSDEEYQAMRDEYSNRFFEIASSLPKDKSSFMATDDAANTMVEAVSKYKTRSGIANYLRRELNGWANYSEQAVDDLIELVRDIHKMPTGYFEAKPQRAVGFDEVGVFVIPNNADVKLKQELLNRGYSIAEYDPNIEGHRQQVVNQFEEYKFSLSNVGEQSKEYGKYNVYGKDIALETAPVPNTDSNTQPVSNTDSNTVNALDGDMFPDDLAPMADDSERLESLTDADMPPEAEAPYTEDGEVTVDDPFEERDWYKVGNRKVNAYMYENPEVKPYFQEEAAMLLAELHDTIKGEKWYNDDLYYQTNGEKGFGGTKRLTSDSIAEMLDGWGMSYADIEKGLNAILEDNGAENIAAAKKIEFMLNDRLLNGYKDFYSRSMTPPNEEYVKLLNEKQITEYSTEAFDAFMANADSYAPPVEDIAPVSKPVQRGTYQAAPVEKYEAIRPKREKQPRMARATPAEQARAEILVDEPKVEQKKKNGLWNWAKVNLLDPGTVFETLSLKSGNPELQAKFSSIKRAESRAQRHMENGNGMSSSLKSIREGVEKTGKTKQFYEYLYHLHNKDRMSLENRYSDVENKPVFGSSITADISALEVAELERKNPEFKRLAQEVYNYMGNLREMLVEGGVISRETAQLWQEMYPHYVPIRREGHDGVNINVPLDSRKTGINAPIKRATGGNSNILPLFDTMAQRTIQTYKAIAKNRFGVELKNTIGHTIESEAAGVDEVIDSIDTHEELLQAGKNGMSPTFTVFENGEKVTFEITEEMYDAMKPKSGAATLNSKVLNKVNDVRRGLITEYNPVFAVTNPIKDIQDVLINSKHPARTYANMPKAIWELRKKGHWYQEYMDNGGEQNTYFESETNTFTKEKSALRKVVGFPIDKLSQVNNFIEKVPRLAEYIASRKAGRSIDVSMLDAARVTTDFSAGGHITKMMNRNGFTFLNASVQGAVQQVRNFREAKYNGLKGWAQLAGKTVAAGLPAMLLNHLLWDDDEEYEELSDYVKQNYYIVGKFDDGKFVRIPKGRTLAVIQNGFEQMENLITGNDEADLEAFTELVISNLAPNNPLDNNIIAPIAQSMRNETWYGEDLVPTRLQDLPSAEQYDESTDSISRWLGEKTNTSPYKWNYLLDQYSGGVGDTFLPMLTPEAERGDDTLLGNLIAPWKDKFTTDAVMNNQNVSDFYTKKDELTVNANAAEATEEDVLMNKYLNSVSAEMSKLYAEKRKIQNSDLPDAEKYAAVRDVQKQIVELTKEGLNTYGDISFEDDYREGGEYARVNDRLYKRNDEGEWSKLSDDQVTKYEVTKAAGNASYATDGTNHYRWYVPGEDADKDTKPGWRKVTDKELEKQQEVTSGLGISPETYWNDREEYSYAYEHPESYAVAKAVGGYEAYRNYSSELYDIKADKDSNGKSISGSRKEKVLDYVNGLDIEYGEKLILFKSEYNADDTYNYEIIDYLNSRDDISFEEMATILKKLGFTVSANGDISW